MFEERLNPNTKSEIIMNLVPTVGIFSDALRKMFVYVDECPDEIGWLGTARKDDGGNIIIDDVFLFDQEVHSTTTEITPEGLSDFAEELLAQGDAGIEIWNNLKMWGHSHVNMGVTPSAQDDKQMETFNDGGHDWFIRLIANKKGELKVDLYDYERGIVYLDLPWVRILDDDEFAMQQKLKELQNMIDSYNEAKVNEDKAVISEEMKLKVRKKITYVPRTSYSYPYGSTYGTQKKTNETKVEETKTLTHGRSTTNTQTSIMGGRNGTDFFEDDDHVVETFFPDEMEEFMICDTFEDVYDTLAILGYSHMIYRTNDIERIIRVAKKLKYAEENKNA